MIMMNQVCDRVIMSLCLGTLPHSTLLYYFNGHVTIRVDIILLTSYSSRKPIVNKPPASI